MTNFKPLILEKLQEFASEFSYTYPQIIFSIMSAGKIDKRDLISMGDEEFYNLIFKTIKKEQEDEQ